MRTGHLMFAALLGLALAPAAMAEDQEFVAGDGAKFTLPLVDGLPGRAEADLAVFESAGFETNVAGAPSLTDRFSFVFKGGQQPVRVRVEDVTLSTPVLIAEVTVPDDLQGAGFRRSRFEFSAAACSIARGEPCSAWMFGDQAFRLYRATLIYDDGESVKLQQAEPYHMAAFVARLGDRIPTRGAEPQTAQSE
jgi:hypothetical protein